LIHYPIPAHLQQAYQFLGYGAGSLPTTEHIVNRILSLPMFPEMTTEQVDQVIEGIKEFYKERGVTAVAADALPSQSATVFADQAV